MPRSIWPTFALRCANLVLGCALLVAATPATARDAASRPDLAAMTCGEARAMVLSRGAVLFSTGPGTYERIVRDGAQCLLAETPRPAILPTRDLRACFVGYVCAPADDILD